MNQDRDPTRPPDVSPDAEATRLLLEGLQAGATIKDLKGVSSDTLEGVYALAYRFYQNGQLEEAETFFRFLCLYDFYNAEYALGMGAVLQLKRDYDKAISMYAVAQALDLQDDRAIFHVGQCQLALGRLSKARDCFEAVAGRAADPDMVGRCQAYLQALEGTTEPATPAQEEPEAPWPPAA